MSESWDPDSAIGDGCLETVKRALAIMSTLWVGCIAAVASYYLSEIAGAIWAGAWSDVSDMILAMFESLLWSVILAPFYLLLSFWGFVLVPLLGLVMFYSLRADREVTWLWFATVVYTGIIALRGLMGESGLSSLAFDVIAWVILVLVMASIAALCLFFQGWRRNDQARHLQEVNAENELRRLEIEQTYGTKSFGQGNQTDFLDE